MVNKVWIGIKESVEEILSPSKMGAETEEEWEEPATPIRAARQISLSTSSVHRTPTPWEALSQIYTIISISEEPSLSHKSASKNFSVPRGRKHHGRYLPR